MSEEQLLEIIEEFEMVSDIKEFFECNCKNKALKLFDITILNKIDKLEPKIFTSDVLAKDIMGVINIDYIGKSPLELVNSEENMDNALKVIINNPDYLLNDYSKEVLSFILIIDKNDKSHYFLNANGNHRVIILIVLSDVCEVLKINDVEILEYKL